jgi:hypothetical protein
VRLDLENLVLTPKVGFSVSAVILQRVTTPGWARELDRTAALTARNQPLHSQAQLVILLDVRPFFNLIEGEGRSSIIRREQVEHRSGLFEPRVVRIGIFLIDVLVEHGVVFHC